MYTEQINETAAGTRAGSTIGEFFPSIKKPGMAPARKQLLNAAPLRFIFKWIAAMPGVHWRIGATAGSVNLTKSATIPAAVGVDIGCGMMAVQTSLNARHLPDNIKIIRAAIENALLHG